MADDAKIGDLLQKDFLPRNELEQLQLERLQKTVKVSYEKVPLFRSRMDERGVKPNDILSLSDVQKLPFMEKSDLRDCYPFGLFAGDVTQAVRLHASSGTTGKPIVAGYTKNDLAIWSEVVARSFVSCGLTDKDVIQICYGYGMFTGGLGAHYGVERLGATVIPAGTGNSDRQILYLKDFGTTAICATPSYFIHLIDKIHEAGISFDDLSLRCGIFGAEPWTLEMRDYIQKVSGIKAFDIYGLTEIIGPGVAVECQAQNGFHLFEDHFLVEVIDPKTEKPLPEGQEGELVFTTLTKELFPMIRYRTHDLSAIISEPCSCGRTLKRFRRIHSRCDDMLIIRGINVFPSQVESAILSVQPDLPHYQIIVDKKNNLDTMEIEIEVTPQMFKDKIGDLEQVKTQIAAAVEKTLQLRVPVRLVEPGRIDRSVGKAKRVIDHRKR